MLGTVLEDPGAVKKTKSSAQKCPQAHSGRKGLSDSQAIFFSLGKTHSQSCEISLLDPLQDCKTLF